MKPYITIPPENWAEREQAVQFYHPVLCFKLGQGHRDYGWAMSPRGPWDEDQIKAYEDGYSQRDKELRAQWRL